MTLTRRQCLALLAAAPLPPNLRLIAHRGGVVDPGRPENSVAAVEEAIRRGYWMVEVDIRRTKDGRAILQHDATFERYYNVKARVEELSWDEISKLRAQPGGGAPMDFEDACRRCAGRIRLMLDIKSDAWPDEFYLRLIDTMQRHGLLRDAYLLGGGKAQRFFEGRCRRSSNRQSLRAAVEQGEDVKRTRFFFELGSVMDEEALGLCRQHGVTPVAAINIFRYTQAKRDEWQDAAEDIARLRRLGVEEFQVDSWYEPLFRGESRPAYPLQRD